jgi:predicted dehydrogenase
MLKVVLVGCGKIADAHVEAIKANPKARLTAVCDMEPLMAEQLAMRYGISRCYSEFEEMLEAESPDVVHVTAPPSAHVPLALQAIRAGAHLFVEKPLALNHTDAKILIESAESAGKLLTTGYIYNFDPVALEIREFLASGLIGDVVHVESYYGYSLKGEFGSAVLSDPTHWVHRLPGKLFHNNIDHLLNKIVQFIPDDAPEIQARAFQRAPESVVGNLQDELRVLIQGRNVSAYATFSANAKPMGHFLRVYGARNSLHADFAARTVVLEPAQTVPSALGRLLPGFGQAVRYGRAAVRNTRRFLRSEFHYFQGMRTLLDAFYEAILNEGDPPIPYRDMLRVAAWMDEIFAQTANQQAHACANGGHR